jgi:hypothetical protein
MARSNSANFSGDSNRKFAYPVYDRELLDKELLEKNEITLIGDAAHPMIHSKGRANQARDAGAGSQYYKRMQTLITMEDGIRKCVNGV